MLARYKADYKDFDNMMFIARIGVRKGEPKDRNDPNSEKWSDKNYLAGALGPESKDWHPIEQPPPFNGGGTGAAAAAPTPASAPASAPADAQSAPITPPKWATQS
jgi:hypothetical protein